MSAESADPWAWVEEAKVAIQRSKANKARAKSKQVRYQCTIRSPGHLPYLQQVNLYADSLAQAEGKACRHLRSARLTMHDGERWTEWELALVTYDPYRKVIQARGTQEGTTWTLRDDPTMR